MFDETLISLHVLYIKPLSLFHISEISLHFGNKTIALNCVIQKDMKKSLSRFLFPLRFRWRGQQSNSWCITLEEKEDIICFSKEWIYFKGPGNNVIFVIQSIYWFTFFCFVLFSFESPSPSPQNLRRLISGTLGIKYKMQMQLIEHFETI